MERDVIIFDTTLRDGEQAPGNSMTPEAKLRLAGQLDTLGVDVIEAGIAAGAKTINLPDTVGYALPAEYGAMFRTVRSRVPNSDRVVFSAHCHDDLGLAVANSLAAIEAGAGQVECTINGIGERAGNAALEEIVMASPARSRGLGCESGVDAEQSTRTHPSPGHTARRV